MPADSCAADQMSLAAAAATIAPNLIAIQKYASTVGSRCATGIATLKISMKSRRTVPMQIDRRWKWAFYFALAYIVIVYLGYAFYYLSLSFVDWGRDGRGVFLCFLFSTTPFAAITGAAFGAS